MSSDDVVIGVRSLSKHYQIYDRPGDRLKQFILPLIALVVFRDADTREAPTSPVGSGT